MADGGQQSGTVSEVARQAADRADRLAEWLGQREPGDLLDEVRSFARRRPGAFLLGAAIAGVVVGRLTRGAVDAAARLRSGAAARLRVAVRDPGVHHSGLHHPRVRRAHDTRIRRPGIHRARRPLRHASRAVGHADAAAGLPVPVPVGRRPPPRRRLPPADDPFGVPDPVDRPASGTVGGYADEVERAGEHTYADERRDAPYRPGDGGLR